MAGAGPQAGAPGGGLVTSAWRRRARALALALPLVAAACSSGGDELSQDDFEARLVEREALSADEAACVSEYVFADYPPEQITVLYEEGVDELPSVLFAGYVQAMLACTLTDDLAAARGVDG